MTSNYGRVPIYDDQWGEQFTTVMRQYIAMLEESVDNPDDEVETLSGVPFCGCSDCYEREGYLMATKLAIEGHEQGKVRLA